jgi:hypothetical protein
MATNAAILRGLGRCAMLLEKVFSRLLDHWMRRHVTRLHASLAQPLRKT